MLIIDEVHHLLAPTYKHIQDNFINLRVKLGLTATLTH